MLFQTVRELKAELRGETADPHMLVGRPRVGVGGVNAGGFVRVAGQSLPTPRSVGVVLGIAPGTNAQDYRIAVRTTRLDQAVNQYVNTLGLVTSGEIDIQHVGDIFAARPLPAARWQEQVRPLLPGYSVGHWDATRGSTAGTIGGFIDKDGATFVLSNNHVLALSTAVNNAAQVNDAILQPGPFDGGTDPPHRIGRLSSWVALQPGTNYVDMALGALDSNVQIDATYNGIRLTGSGQAQLNTAVWKVGRTTGVTHGRVMAIGLDDVPVGYLDANGTKVVLYFDDQMEIQGDGAPFSAGGDSGSMIIDASQAAVGLLFAGSRTTAKTYGNPIGTVLQHTGGSLLR